MPTRSGLRPESGSGYDPNQGYAAQGYADPAYAAQGYATQGQQQPYAADPSQGYAAGYEQPYYPEQAPAETAWPATQDTSYEQPAACSRHRRDAGWSGRGRLRFAERTGLVECARAGCSRAGPGSLGR